MRTIYLFSFLFICSHVILAQNESIKAVRIVAPVVVDGRLTDSIWASAIPFTSFKMVEPTPGLNPSELTELKVLYDKNGIYFGINCYDSDPGKITANSMQHDQGEERNEDQISILIDPFQDKRTGYMFIVNSKGARSEGLASGEHSSLGWDGLWEARCKKSENGWSAEIYISFKTISFNPKLHSWGLNVERYIARKQEVIRYSGISLNSFFSNPKEAGLMEGIENIKQGLGITFRPYGKLSYTDVKTDDSSPEKSLKGGFDLYKNITPNLVGAVTVNTDFAETEVDARRLNLTRFPLYYPEKRTFFLEGSDIFEFGSTNASTFIPFFSRRIGLTEGQQIPLKWGAKMFGKIGNTNISMLDVQTGTTDITQPTNMFAGRISQNIFDESKVGFIFTNGSQTGEKNMLAGADFKYKTSRFLGGDNFSVDVWGVTNQNELKGGNKNAGGLKIDYPNDLVDAAVTYNFFGDSLQPGLGFLPRRGVHSLNTNISYMPRPEKGWIGDLVRQFYFQMRFSNYWNLKGELESRMVFFAPFNVRTESGEHLEFSLTPTRDVLPEDFEVSDGVIISKGDYKFTSFQIEASSASHRMVQGELEYRFGQFYDGHLNDIQGNVNLKFNGYANIEVGANLVRGNLPEGDFDENLYFGRLNLYLTPDLGITNYVQFDDVTNRIGYNGRFFYQLSPGNIIYLVYNKNIERLYNQDANFRSLEDQVLFKLQLSLRI